jgi:hypothetical protein
LTDAATKIIFILKSRPVFKSSILIQSLFHPVGRGSIFQIIIEELLHTNGPVVLGGWIGKKMSLAFVID